MSLLDKLREKGWYLTENGLKKLTENQNNVHQSSDHFAIIKLALDSDFREIAGGAIASKADNQIPGNIVLQIMKIRNVSAPKANEDSKSAQKLLKLQLTDGQTQTFAVEIENIPALTLNTPPGTKVLLKNGPIKISHGMLLIDSKNIEILGGTVAALVEKWEVNRSLAKYAKGGRINLSSSGPPRFIAFGKEIPKSQLDEPFNSMAEAQAGPRQVVDENSEFNSQRTEAISEAIKTETKKVFGGGTKPLQDANVQKIMDKGFSEEQAKTALRYNKNNVEHALNSLRRRQDRNSAGSERTDNNGAKPGPNRKGGRPEKEKIESTKPSGKISLFDFVEEKLPQAAGDATANAQTYHSDKKSDTDKRNSQQNRFENNISASFANRGKYPNQNAQNSNNYYNKGYDNRQNQQYGGGRGGGRDYNTNNRNDYNSNRGGGGGGDQRQVNSQRDNYSQQPNNRHHVKERTSKQDSYNQKQDSYSQKQDGYSQKQDGYGQKQDNYGHKQGNYSQKQDNYGQKQDYSQKPDSYDHQNQNYVKGGYHQNRQQSQQQHQTRDQRDKDRSNNSYYDSGYQNKPNQYQGGRNQNQNDYQGRQQKQPYQKSDQSQSTVQPAQYQQSQPQSQQYQHQSRRSPPQQHQQINTQQSSQMNSNKPNTKQPYNKSQQQQHGGSGHSGQHQHQHQQQMNQLEKVTGNLKISNPNQNTTAPSQSSQATSKVPHQVVAPQQVVAAAKPAPGFTPVNGGGFNPYQIMGFQNKATNEFAMNVLKTQQLPPVAAPPQTAVVPIVPISTVPVPAGLVPQSVATFAAPPSVIPSPQPAQPFGFPPPPGTAVFPLPTYQVIKWNVGDICMAKYWEDGRYYPAEVTGASESTNVVRFLDYGNYEEVLKVDCLPMNTASVATAQPYANQAVRQAPAPGIPSYKSTASHQVAVAPNANPNAVGKYREQRIYVPPPAQRK